MRRSESVAVLAVACMAATAPSTGRAQNSLAEIRAEVRRFIEVFNRHDSIGLANLYVNRPGVATLGDGQVTPGWQGIARLFGEIFRAGDRFTLQVEDSVAVMPLGADVALAYFRYHLVTADPPPSAGVMTIVFVRTPQGWRVAHDHTSTAAPDSAGTKETATREGAPSEPVRPTRTCVVTRIVDGDTIDCRGVGRIRLIGMDTPEMSQAPFGAEAARALAALVPTGDTIRVEPDVEPRDRYGRTLAYLWTSSGMVNWRLIRNGWAMVATYPPNVQYVEVFADAMRRAREERLGLWATGGFDCAPAERRRGRCD